ncbi:hypothetical protein [Cellulomonas xiejunii]|uniref:Uncharacterized protein n=1 Tax=Cellulomonas xiejunii TaxID=2968083 RepID=A0ABY5KMV9_9CELL|nr:hypothetical protein [Cellulomonas xiejunii]MCC2320802.1 hypothetical protein [Cellulomonas xiejunii]UUI71088.1 hypothetical protein NP048_15000 [Cellulomonas xiejunii]
MNVSWAATDVSGRFVPQELESDISDFVERCEKLRSVGSGYVEVRRPQSDFPVVTLGFRGKSAVLHVMHDPEQVLIMSGDGSLPSGGSTEVPVMGDLTEFDGQFVVTVDEGWAALLEFLRSGRLPARDDLIDP